MRAHSSVPVACSLMAKIILPVLPFFYFFKFGIQPQRQEMFCSSCGVICRPDSYFCHACGCRVAADAINSLDEVIITDYFYCGFQSSATIGLLKKHQRLCIHVRTAQILNNLCTYHQCAM